MTAYPSVTIREEGMREGMQIESADISVADKIRLLNALSETGLRQIVVGSFVSPRWTPQMAHVEEVIQGFTPRPGVTYSALTVNDRGRERAAAYTPPLSPREGLPTTTVHLCDVFVQRNYNRTQAQEIARWGPTIEDAHARGATRAGMVLGAAWGSNWVGEFSDEQRLSMLRRMYNAWAEAGIEVTSLGFLDPMGWNMPDQMERTLSAIKRQWPGIREFQMHLHNTRGTALTSIYAALKVLDPGDTVGIDASIGGMAGCPYCGNGRGAPLVATEDLVNFLEELGIPTGVDLLRLIEVVWLAEEIVGHPLYGHVSKAGPRPRFNARYPMDMPFVETLDQAKHFITGPSAYAGAMSPWKEPIRSWQRPESLDQPAAAARPVESAVQAAPDGHSGQAGPRSAEPLFTEMAHRGS
jgi:hydroxymethylglutaryl-CoA lyase